MTYFQQRLAHFSRALDKPVFLSNVIQPLKQQEFNTWVVVKNSTKVIGFNLTKKDAAELIHTQMKKSKSKDPAYISFEVISEKKAKEFGLLHD